MDNDECLSISRAYQKEFSSNLYKKYCGEILIREVENNGMVGFAYPVFLLCY